MYYSVYSVTIPTPNGIEMQRDCYSACYSTKSRVYDYDLHRYQYIYSYALRNLMASSNERSTNCLNLDKSNKEFSFLFYEVSIDALSSIAEHQRMDEYYDMMTSSLYHNAT